MSRAGPGVISLAVTSGNVGDAWVLAIHLESTSATISSVTGGGTSWRRIVGPFADNLSFPRGDDELWGGVITTTGPSLITVSATSSLAGVNAFLDAQEFSAGLGASTKWAVDGTSWGAQNNAWSPAVRFPTLTPSAGSVDLYFGYAWVANTGSAGTTPGFSYRMDGSANVVAYNGAVSGSISPVAAQSPGGPSVSMAILVKAS